MSFSEILDDGAYEAARKLARGCYQRNLLDGVESLSGSTLKGKAAKYSSRYARSRANYLDRLKTAGIQIDERRGPKGKRILIIGRPPYPTAWQHLNEQTI